MLEAEHERRNVQTPPVRSRACRCWGAAGRTHGSPRNRTRRITGRARPATAVESVSTSIEQNYWKEKIIAAISLGLRSGNPGERLRAGLIYGIDIADDNSVKIRMTLTAPGCPVAGSLPGEVEKQVENVPEVKDADVELVWEPAWTKSPHVRSRAVAAGFL